MIARSLARLLVVVALVCAGLVWWVGTSHAQSGPVVQNGNESFGAEAISAPVEGGNEAFVTSGPSSQDGGRAAMVGNTDTRVNQSADAQSGPMSAGSQTTNARGNTTVQNSNRSEFATAEGDPVTAFNSVDAHNGPYAFGEGADASMVGNGNLRIDQDATALGGPGNAGSQFTDARGSAVVQNANACGDAISDCGFALVGGVDVFNVFGDSFIDPFVPSGTGPVAVSEFGDPVTASLVGDADAVIRQSAFGASGGADVGMQDTDARGGVTQNDNFTAFGDAESGPVFSENFATATIGPLAWSFFAGSASMVGRATGRLDQDSSATSGDAKVGSQTTGNVGDRAGAVTVQNRSSSEDDVAVTGAADASNEVLANAGPVAVGFDADADAGLVGDARFDIRTTANADSGDAWAGYQDTQARGRSVVQNDNDSLGGFAFSGDACAAFFCDGGNFVEAVAGPFAFADFEDASAHQVGDARVDLRLDANATTGRAAVGFQVTDARDRAIVSNVNTSLDGIAETGEGVAGNEIFAGAGPSAIGDLTAADATLHGDARVTIRGRADAVTGDAETGGQNVRATGRAEVLNDNFSDFDETLSGDAFATNVAGAQAGPFAGLFDVVLLFDGLSTPFQDDPGLPIDFGDLRSSASQNGNARVDLDLRAGATSGDAAAGVQDTDARGGEILNSNFSEDSAAHSATACAAWFCEGEVQEEIFDIVFVDFVPGGNEGYFIAGPVAGGEGGSSSTMDGNSDLSQRMRAEATSGDAVAGSQFDRVTGNPVVANINDALGATAGCVFLAPEDCQVTAGNQAQVIGGPLAFAEFFDLNATATMEGNARLDGRATAIAEGGDNVAGSQFTRAGGRSIVENDNYSEDAEAVAGPATAYNGLGVDPFFPDDPFFVVVLGPVAFADFFDDEFAALVGNVTFRSGGDARATSGDAFAGSQLTTNPRGTAQSQNESILDLAESGGAFAFNFDGGFFGPENDVEVGNIRDSFSQRVRAESGAAFAGTQVIGAERLRRERERPERDRPRPREAGTAGTVAGSFGPERGVRRSGGGPIVI